MKRCVEHRHLPEIGPQLIGNLDPRQVGRIVEGGKRDLGTDALDN